MEYKQIIWDWNGTIINDAWLGVEAINTVLDSRKLPLLNLEKYRDVFGFPVKDYYERIGFNFKTDPFDVVGTEFMNIYNLRRFECSLFENAFKLIEKLFEYGISHLILSARKSKELFEDIEFYGITHFFTQICGLDDHYGGSKVEIGKKAISASRISKEQTIMVGDTLHDVEVAQSIGVDCVLISGGHQSKNKLLEAKVPVLDSLAELPLFLNFKV